MINIYEAKTANKRKSAIVLILFFVFTALALYVLVNALNYYYGYQMGGLGVFGTALIFSSATSFFGYYFSDRIVLTISSARPADRKKDFDFFTTVENLSIGAGIPKPKLYVIEDSAPNAFATGRDPDHAVVVATTGLLEKLNKPELEGVMAHELSHIRNYDTRLQTIVAVLVGIIALLADWFLRASRSRKRENSKSSNLSTLFIVLGFIFALISPIIAKLIQLAISRRREFTADASSVEITRQPSGLISALQKISKDYEPLEAANKATAHLYIINPFKGKIKRSVNMFSSLFNTHPPVEERIGALRKMA